jgi:hypothetical protein
VIKDLFETIKRLYSLKIIIAYILLFIIIQIPLFQIVPDFLKLDTIESPESYLRSLLTIVIGFSGIILTIFLVVYNSISKKLRRYSFDFIFDNPWIRVIFSIFSGSIIFIAFSLITVNKSSENSIISSLYFSSLISFLSLIIQFPLILSALKHSNSYRQIKQLIDNISEKDITVLVRPAKVEIIDIEVLERNRIILLKDIGVFAIKENDWGIPQTIINELYEKLIEPLNSETNREVIKDNTSSLCFILNHFKNIAISETDYITTRVTLNALYRIHFHYAKNKIRNLRNNSVDEVLKDMLRRLIENNNFYQLQSDILNSASSVIREHLKSIEYSDEDLPTSDYNMSNLQNRIEYKHDDISNYWFYVKNDLPDLFFEPLIQSLDCKNKNVYDYYNMNLHNLFSDIYDSKTLTEHQKNDAYNQFSYRARMSLNCAIRNEVYENISIHSNTQIETWLIDKRKYAWSAFYDFSNLLEKLNKKNIATLYIDDFFYIARSISHKNIDKQIKNEVIDFIVKKGFELFRSEDSNDFTKSELNRQLKWLNDYLIHEEDLLELKEKYSSEMESLT